MNKRFTVEESNLISIFMEEGIDLDVGGRKNVINGINKTLKHLEDDEMVELSLCVWTIVNKKDTIFKYIFWERLDSLPIPECCFHFVWCQIA